MISRESDKDTIAAIATASGEGGIGIVRLSGKRALEIADQIFLAQNKKSVLDQKNYTARFGHVVSKKKSSGVPAVIDEAILLVMRGPKSYTTEDVVEIQVHGGNVILQEILSVLVQEGARLASPGEFTKRAFLNGRIDLLQAEAVLDLIQARTEKSRQWASSQLGGVLSEKAQQMKLDLLQILSALEASIDFPEDGLEENNYSEIEKKLLNLQAEIKDLLAGSDLGILAKRGVRVVLWGRPNTGKSSLMNRLVRQNRVIVTPIPGTTRDVVEEEIQLNGFPFRLFDTAGIQETDHVVEREGILRSRKAVFSADLVLFLVDSSTSLGQEDLALYKEIESKPKIIVLNKADLPKKAETSILKQEDLCQGLIEVSCQTGEGVDSLEQQIFQWAAQGKSGIGGESVISSIRQKYALEKMWVAAKNASDASAAGLSPELIAVDVRLAMEELGVLVGDIVTDEVLEVLFSKFCIGK